MIGFLKSRARKNAEAREAEVSPAIGTALLVKTSRQERGEQINEAPTIEPTIEARPLPADRHSGTLPNVDATAPADQRDRYEIREIADGCSVYDTMAGDTAETYGYRLARMSRMRAESIVAVLNRGEIRKRGWDG
jgi:hypothetical protein